MGSTWLGEEEALAGRTEGSIVSVGLRLLKPSEQSGLGAAAGSWVVADLTKGFS
jgi:hypothetical protein